jgi:hypothetical protein
MPNGVRIDAGQVGDLGRDLRIEADCGFGEAARRGAVLHGQGVEFGARLTPSGVVTEAKQRYAQALANSEANLRAYQSAAAALADAAEEVARLFGSSDRSAAEAQRTAQDVIDGAAP